METQEAQEIFNSLAKDCPVTAEINGVKYPCDLPKEHSRYYPHRTTVVFDGGILIEIRFIDPISANIDITKV